MKTMKHEIKRVVRAPIRKAVMSLHDLRVARGMTQLDVAKSLSVSPTVISKRESSGPHLNVSTLQDYARALGAQCEIVFVFPLGHRITVDLGEEGFDAALDAKVSGL